MCDTKGTQHTMNMDIQGYLNTFFEELTPYEFYRGIFPSGELGKKGVLENGKYCAIAVEITKKKKDNGTPLIHRYSITDDLEQIEELQESDNFIIISPISYCGKSRDSKNARFIYAMAIDLDYGAEAEQQHLTDLFFQIKNERIPKPTYIVHSGKGLHLYYVFEKPIPCFQNVSKELSKLKNNLTIRIWNKYVTDLYKTPQIQSLFQGFRMVGGVTKNGSRTKAYEVGSKVTIEYLNSFLLPEEGAKNFTYKSNLPLKKAKEQYPEWYEKRIVKKQKKGTWTCKRDLYEWWKREMLSGATVGHRYYCMMCLSIYAKKSGVPYAELEADAYEIMQKFEELTESEDNHFTETDVFEALEMYNDSYFTFPIESISKLTDIHIEKNKRNYRKQETHLKIARFTLELMNEENGKALQGRPTKEHIIKEWQQNNPKGTPKECIEDTNISKNTVYKYWTY